MPCEQFLQAFEIYRALLRAKQVEEKRGKLQNAGKIVHMQLILNFIFLLLENMKITINSTAFL